MTTTLIKTNTTRPSLRFGDPFDSLPFHTVTMEISVACISLSGPGEAEETLIR